MNKMKSGTNYPNSSSTTDDHIQQTRYNTTANSTNTNTTTTTGTTSTTSNTTPTTSIDQSNNSTAASPNQHLLNNTLQNTHSNSSNNNNNNNNNVRKQKDELYWCWLLKEYIRLGHAKSVVRIIRIIDHLSPYLYFYKDLIYETQKSAITTTTTNEPSVPSTSISTINKTESEIIAAIQDENNISRNNINRRKDFLFHYQSRPIFDPKRTNFPYLYIPNLIRQRSDLFQYFNRSFSFNNILFALSNGTIDTLILQNFLPIPKSIPMIPFLLTLVYIKLCVSKGDALQSIMNSLMECKQKAHLLQSYDFPSIPIDQLLDSIMQGTLRFVDWNHDTYHLVSTEVFFNELFESFFLIGRESLLNREVNSSNNNSNNSSNTQLLNQSQQQLQQRNNQQQQQDKQQQKTSNILPSIPLKDEYRFKIIDIYLEKSSKMVYYHTRALAQKRGNIHSLTWTLENVNILHKCIKYYLDVYLSQQQSNSYNQETLSILDCCMRLAFSWVAACSGLHPTPNNQKYIELESCWWNSHPQNLQNELQHWMITIKRILHQVVGQESDKLHVICLVWLSYTISLYDDDQHFDTLQQQQQNDQPKQPLQLEETPYQLYTKTITQHPKLLLEFSKSSLVITSLSFALIGVQTLDQSAELIQILLSLWTNNQQQPSLENACLIFKLLQNVLSTKFKKSEFSDHTELVMAIIAWMRCISDEVYSSFYSSNPNCRFICIFIASSLVNAVQKNKNIYSLIPLEEKNILISKVQEIFYTLINQHTFLSKSFKTGLATAYCLSSIEPSFDKQASQSILMISLDVLFDELLGIDNCLISWLDKPQEINYASIKKIFEHNKSPLFLALAPFIQTITRLTLHLQDNDNNKLVLLKIFDFTYSLNEKWVQFTKDSSSTSTTKYPKSYIKSTLDPTMRAISQTLSFIFTDISSILTAMDSVLGVEIFSQMSYTSNDDIPYINSAIKSLVKKVATSECAVIRLVDKMPVYFELPKDDPSGPCVSKVILYLSALDSLVVHVPHSLIIEHIVPNLFGYMEYPNSKLNMMTHTVMGKVLSIPNFSLNIKMIPMYLKLSLKSFPKYTKLSSFYNVLINIIESNSPTNPIVLYSIKTISQTIIEQMKNNNTNNINNNNNNNNQDKTKINNNNQNNNNNLNLNSTTKGLVKLLLSLFTYIDIQIIELVLNEISKVIYSAPHQKIRLDLCSDLLTVITGNIENNSKKNICVSWYLKLIKDIQKTGTNNNNNNNQQNPPSSPNLLIYNQNE
ncbi:hypothetical protein CYY_006971 [Polysphondylium violaceum]|uniref:Uncharacterized protein n=1 Tax=Polysphondylium violaceum TaxID=133409 RepID=A0A8J4PPA1_9MYCE|nr:hypothetical protein CYY_006971 [Polysphondylium violaceum]